jgi:UDP-N-acetylglucosamine:LPS N-acetylglucosamine transferase
MSRNILILHASIGAGHERPACEMATRLRLDGHRVRVVDLVTLARGGGALRGVFRGILTRRPELWGRISERLDDGADIPGPIRALAAVAGGRIARIADDDDVDLVISTYPLGGRVVEQARIRSARRLPLVTYVTDPAVHRLWLDAATDRYLATWTFTADELRRRTVAPVSLVAPVLADSFWDDPMPRLAASAADVHGVALVASGSWAVGEVLQSVHDLVADGRFHPVVVCGRNGALRAAVARIPGVSALGWVDDMADLMRHCAVAVLNSGGLTLAEAAVVGIPVVHHRPLPVQGDMNAVACLRGADVPVSRTRAELSGALSAARDMHPFLGRASAVAAALETLRPASTMPGA